MTYLLLASIMSNLATVGFFLRAQAVERRATARERATLLNRIQAPELAVAQDVAPDAPEPVYIPLHDDQALVEG